MLWMLLVVGIAPPSNSPVDPLPNLRIESDSAVVIRRAANGYVVAADASGKLLDGEKEMLAQTLQRPEEAKGPNSLKLSTNREVNPLIPGSLRFNLIEYHGEMLLMIQNGMSQSFAYKARIGSGPNSMPTDVCQLLPQTRSFEHWPYKFEWIEITDVRPVAHVPGEPPRCE